MKRSLSLLLTISLLIGLLSGLSLYATAAELTSADISGIVAPVAGADVVTTGFSGAPDGFNVTVGWYKYNYSVGTFERYNKATFDDDAVYRLDVEFQTKGTDYLPEGWEWDNFTINGAQPDSYYTMEFDGDHCTCFGMKNFYTVGDITTLDQVTITQLPAEQAGTSTAATGVTVPSGNGYYVDDVSWVEETQWEDYTGAALQENGQYVLFVAVYPEEGYWFDLDTEVTAPMEVRNSYLQEANGYMNVSFHYDLRTWVDKVELTGDFDFAYGDKTADFAFTIPANAAYNVELVQFRRWSDAEGWIDGFSGTFNYDEHILQLQLTPKGGAVLADDIQIMINGEPAEGNWDIHGDEDEKTLEYWFMIEPEKGFVEDMELSGAPAEITAGSEIKAPTIKKENGAATIKKVQWVDANYAPVTGKFEANKVYYLAITLQADAGYAIREGYYVEMENTDGGYDHPYVRRNDDGTVTVYARYSLLPKIEKIELQLPEATIGSALGEPTVPSGAKYKLEDYYWWAQQGDGQPTKYEDNNKYYLEAYLTPAEGYEFGDKLVVTINGKEIDDFGNSESSCYVNHSVSFLKKIQKIEFPALPAVKVGDTLEEMQLQAPAGANYTIWAYWIIPEGFLGTESYTGPAKDKSVYYLVCEASPNTGYEFAQDVTYTVGGKTFDGFGMEGEEWVTLLKQYVFGLQVIDTITINAETPVLGQKPGKITVPADAHYKLEEGDWGKSKTDKMEDTQSVKKDETFQAGMYYWISGSLKADEGYVFSENAKIVINGKQVSTDAFREFLGMPSVWGQSALAYANLGKLVDPTNPDTGDNMQLGLCMVLSVVSLAGLGITATKKKYF